MRSSKLCIYIYTISMGNFFIYIKIEGLKFLVSLDFKSFKYGLSINFGDINLENINIFVNTYLFPFSRNHEIFDITSLYWLEYLILLFIFSLFSLICLEKLNRNIRDSGYTLCIWYFFFLSIYSIFWYLPLVSAIFQSNIVTCFMYQNGAFCLTWFSYVVKTFIIFIGFFFFCCIKHNERLLISFEYCLFIVGAILSSFYMITSNSLLVIFLFMEMQSFIFYILCSMHNTKNTIENLSMEACLKYFIYGSFASAFFLFGVALIYASIGTLDIYQIMYNLQDSYLNNSGILFLGAFLILIGILFKLAIFPFHVWIGDVYQGAGYVTLIFLAIIPKLAFFVLFFNLYKLLFQFIPLCNDFLLFFAFCSIIYGALTALYQTDIKRFVAFSAINNAGYILLLFIVQPNVVVPFYYLVIYLIVSFTFLIILNIMRSMVNVNIEKVSDLSLILSNNIFFSIFLVMTILSFCGIPIFAGFFGKFILIKGLVSWYNYFLVIIFVLVTVLTCAYYIRLIRFIFNFKNLELFQYSFSAISYNRVLPVLFLVSLNIFFMVYQVPFFLFLNSCL